MPLAIVAPPAVGRPALGLPLGKAAVEDRDVVRAEQAQQPPGARRRMQRAVVVNHDAAAVAEAEALHPRREFLRRRRHVLDACGGICQLGKVHEQRARDMLGLMLGACIALHVRQELGRIDDAQVRCLQLSFEPARIDQSIHRDRRPLNAFARHSIVVAMPRRDKAARG